MPGSVLVPSAADREAQPMYDVFDRSSGERGEQVADFFAGQGNPVGRCRCAGAFGRGDDGEERVREHREHGPTMPGDPAPDLVLIQAGQTFAGLKRFLDAPPGSSRADQDGAAAWGWVRSSGRTPALSCGGCVGSAATDVDQGPVVEAVSFRPGAADSRCHTCLGSRSASSSGAEGPSCSGDATVASDGQHVADAAALQFGNLRPIHMSNA